MPITREIQADIANDFVAITPRWLRIALAVKYSQMGRAKLYIHLSNGDIKSFVLRNKGAVRGIRLVDRFSIDAFLDSKAEASYKCDAPRQQCEGPLCAITIENVD
jgi:hypothetical protein